jgi:flavodoxin
MQKTLLVYYSLSGNTKKVAEEMARIGDWDVGVIKDASPRKGTWGYMCSALETMFKLMPAIDYIGNDPGAYDTVVLGSPIWVGRPAAPMRSFAHQYKGKLKNIACFCTMGGTDSKGWQAQLGSVYGQTPKQLLALQEKEATSETAHEKMHFFVNSINNRLRIAA